MPDCHEFYRESREPHLEDNCYKNIVCTICNVECSGPVPYAQHKQGARHQQSLARYQEHETEKRMQKIKDGLYCDTCDVESNGPASHMQHMSGARHFENLKRQTMSEKISRDQFYSTNKFSTLKEVEPYKLTGVPSCSSPTSARDSGNLINFVPKKKIIKIASKSENSKKDIKQSAKDGKKTTKMEMKIKNTSSSENVSKILETRECKEISSLNVSVNGNIDEKIGMNSAKCLPFSKPVIEEQKVEKNLKTYINALLTSSTYNKALDQNSTEKLQSIDTNDELLTRSETTIILSDTNQSSEPSVLDQSHKVILQDENICETFGVKASKKISLEESMNLNFQFRYSESSSLEQSEEIFVQNQICASIIDDNPTDMNTNVNNESVVDPLSSYTKTSPGKTLSLLGNNARDKGALYKMEEIPQIEKQNFRPVLSIEGDVTSDKISNPDSSNICVEGLPEEKECGRQKEEQESNLQFRNLQT